MNREIWEFYVNGQYGVIERWLKTEKISVKERAKLDAALSRLRTLDRSLIQSTLLAPIAGTKVHKLRLRCENRELRPHLCYGPVGNLLDLTFLIGAIEQGDKPRPPDPELKADANRKVLLRNPTWRNLFQ